MKKGCPYGTHRVISPKGVLPQPADVVDNNMDEIYDNEVLIDVKTLNIDSASFTEIERRAGGDIEKIASLAVREQIGRFKYVEEQDIQTEFAKISEEITKQMQTTIEKEEF